MFAGPTNRGSKGKLGFGGSSPEKIQWVAVSAGIEVVGVVWAEGWSYKIFILQAWGPAPLEIGPWRRTGMLAPVGW